MDVRKSMFMNWRTCPLMYKAIWVDGMRSPAGVEQQFGTMFHDSAAKLFKELNYERLKSGEELINVAREQQLLPGEPEFLADWMLRLILWEGKRLFQFKDVDRWKPLFLEQEFRGNGFLCHVDRIDLSETNALRIVEYKTNKSFRRSPMREELTFYLVAINAIKPIPEKRATDIAIFNPQLDMWYIETIPDRYINMVARRIQQVRMSEVFPARPSLFCRYCVRLQKCLDEEVFD